MPTLFEISERYQALDELLDGAGGDLTDPAVEAYVDEIVSELESDRDAKLDGYCAYIAELQARADARQAEADRLAARAKVDEGNAARLKERLRALFELRGWGKVETPRYTLRLTNNGGKLPLDLDADIRPEDLAERFRRVKVDVDTEAVRAALEAGEEIPFARFGTRGNHLRIR